MKNADVVICGAGIGGISTAYMLSVKHGVKNILLVDERSPMTLTSDKSTECYRNWWSGPGDEMVRLMNRSIDIMEEIAEECGNLFHMNQRGYLYATLDNDKTDDLVKFAKEASLLGAGDVRFHNSSDNGYVPAEIEGFKQGVSGADIILDSELIKKYFPYLSEDTKAVLHVRKAGWFSAQQYGMYLFELAKANGVRFIQDRITNIELENDKVSSVELGSGEKIRTDVFVNAAGPMVGEVAEMLGIELPIFNELHMKSSFNDSASVINRDAPLVILIDKQDIGWSVEEREWLQEEEENKWLLETLPSGAHFRPEGGSGANSVILLWDLKEEKVEPEFPPELDPFYPELAMRGLTGIAPGLQTYVEKLPKPFLDGGYYTKTKENRPLACEMGVDGAYLIGAMSGFGIMSSAALAELLAARITGSELPDYALSFSLARYQDSDYKHKLENWSSDWQL